jgi:cytochrome c oxidase cbb3-type subunit 4
VAAEMNISDQSMDVVRGILMVGLVVAFLGMWVWAWSGKRKKVFHDASMLPLEEDNGQIPQLENEWGNGKKDRIEE